MLFALDSASGNDLNSNLLCTHAQDDFGKTSAAVTNVLGFLGLRGNDAKREEEEELDRKLKEVASKKQAKATKAKPSRSSSNTKQSMDEGEGLECVSVVCAMLLAHGKEQLAAFSLSGWVSLF